MKIKNLLTVLIAGMAIMSLAACSSGRTSNSVVSTASSSDQSSAASEDNSGSESSDETSLEESQPSVPEVSYEQGTPVDASWFDDAVFVGDSVTLMLSYYSDNGSLGDAKFLCAGSLGWNNALMGIDEEGNVHPFYEGQQYRVPDGLKVINPKKIFIMLGMNDIGLYGVDGAIDGMKQLMDQIVEACPDAVIYVESVTPMLVGSQLTDLNNTTIAEFNQKVQPVCQERGFKYLDVASAMDDGNGNLVYEYCGDPDAMGLHFSDAGCEVWVDYLKNHVN